MSMKLSDKQKAFCREYVIDYNATQACIRAGYSKKTAKEMGYEHLTKPHIQAYVASLTNKVEEKFEIRLEDTLRRIYAMATDDEIKPNDRLKAEDMLMKYGGGYERNNEQKSAAVTFEMKLS